MVETKLCLAWRASKRGGGGQGAGRCSNKEGKGIGEGNEGKVDGLMGKLCYGNSLPRNTFSVLLLWERRDLLDRLGQTGINITPRLLR